MMTVGIPLIEPPRPKLTKWQKYLKGKKCYEYLLQGFDGYSPPPFKNLKKGEQLCWIELAINGI